MDFPQMPMQPPQQSATEISNHMPAAMPIQSNQPNPMQPMNQIANNGFVPHGEQTQMPKVEPPSQNMFKMQKGRSQLKFMICNLNLSNFSNWTIQLQISKNLMWTFYQILVKLSPLRKSRPMYSKLCSHQFLNNRWILLIMNFSTVKNNRFLILATVNAILQPKQFPMSS